jgi:hypothetical protein
MLLGFLEQLPHSGRHDMSTVTSADGTVIDYDRYGDGARRHLHRRRRHLPRDR